MNNYKLFNLDDLMASFTLGYKKDSNKTNADKAAEIGSYIYSNIDEIITPIIIDYYINNLSDETIITTLNAYTCSIIINKYSQDFIDGSESEKLLIYGYALGEAKKQLNDELSVLGAEWNFNSSKIVTTLVDSQKKYSLDIATDKVGNPLRAYKKLPEPKLAFRTAAFKGIESECLTKVFRDRINNTIKAKTALNVPVEKFVENLEKLADAIHLTDSLKIKLLGEFFIQINTRLNGYTANYGRMLCLYGKQGSGKTVLADIIGKVISNSNRPCKHSIDDILGMFGTLDVFQQPVIICDEFGRQNKNTGDQLKRLITGDGYSCNRKYKEPITDKVLASLILTTNTDPTMLMCSETGNRRLVIIEQNELPKVGIEELEDIVKAVWGSTPSPEDINENRITLNWDERELNNELFEETQETAIEEFIDNLQIKKYGNEDVINLFKDKYVTISKFATICGVSKNFAKNVLESKYFDKHTSGKVTKFKTNKEFESIYYSFDE